MLTWISRHVASPLWEFDNGTRVLPEARGLEATQWLPLQELRARQWARLRAILDEAYRHCAYYRDSWTRHGIDPGLISSPEDLRRLPLLSKRDIQRDGAALLHDGFNRDGLVESKTGGSTGAALTVYADWHCRDLRNAAAVRSDRWAGWEVGVKRAALWGNPPEPQNVRQRIRKALYERVTYLDTMNLSDETMAEFVRRWGRERPKVLFGHSHSLYIWASWLNRRGICAIRPRGIISTSMMLLPSERAVIEEAFGCRVTDRYGCEEVGLIACECEQHRGMHLNVDHLFVECLTADGSPARPGEAGELVVTDLVNRGMPLIRYRIEDMAVPSDRACPCGRGLPLIESVVGRTADFLTRLDGSQVAGVSLVERTLTALPGIEQLQIVQEALDDIVLHVVPMAGYGSDTERRLVGEFHAVFGTAVRVRVNRAARIPQQASGKYRFAINRVATAGVPV
jgi:phenylacetate-CoA ligase